MMNRWVDGWAGGRAGGWVGRQVGERAGWLGGIHAYMHMRLQTSQFSQTSKHGVG